MNDRNTFKAKLDNLENVAGQDKRYQSFHLVRKERKEDFSTVPNEPADGVE
jgi:hypothetical protein